MSLINDALKRAAAEKPRAAASPSDPPLQPVESSPASSSKILPIAVLLLAVGVLGIAAALWFRAPGETKQVAHLQREISNPQTLTGAQAPGGSAPDANSSTALVVSKDAVGSKVPIEASPVNRTPESANDIAAQTAALNQTVEPAAAIASAEAPGADTAKVTNSGSTGTKVTESTRPKPSATSSNPKLQAIYFRMKGPTAVINGKTVSVGQTVDGIKIISIQRTSVEVQQNGRYKTLTLGQD